MANRALVAVYAVIIVVLVLAVTEYSLHERISSGLPLLVVMYTLIISGCVYMLRWNHKKNVEHARWMKKQQGWSFRDSDH